MLEQIDLTKTMEKEAYREEIAQMEPPVRAFFTFAEYEGVWIVSAEIPSIDLTERVYFRLSG